MKYTGKQTGIELVDVDDGRFRMTWKHPNPLKNDAIPKALRKAIELYFDNELT